MPCKKESPSFAALYHEFKGSDLAILKISIKEREKVVLTYQEQFKIAFPILLDEKVTVANAFGVWRHPTTLLINRNGQVVGRVIGGERLDV